jgi:hypothetical protein
MAKLLKLRRGTDTQHTTFTGSEGEVTVNTTNDSLHVHDGSTAGGTELAKADLSNVDGNLSNDLGFSDNVKATFGDGDDLQIYHNGTESFIKDNGTGALNLQSDPGVYIQSADGTKTSGVFNPSGAVTLRHNHQQKLATTSTGIDVTGNIECDGGNVTGQLNVNKLVVDDDGSTSPTMVVKSDDNAITGFVVKNDTYSTNEEIGFKINQGNDGTVQVMNVGNSEYKGINFQTLNGSGGVKNAIIVNPEASVDLYYNNGVKLQTQSGGINVTGTVNCDGMTSEGVVTISTGDGRLDLKDSNTSGVSSQSYVRGLASNDAQQWYVGTASGDSTVTLMNNQGGQLNFGRGGVVNCFLDNSGHLLPNGNNAYDLGSSSNRWRNVYTNDLNLSNEGGANDVDGTWGSWTIQEGEDDLFLLNRRNGKKYKFNLSEVN